MNPESLSKLLGDLTKLGQVHIGPGLEKMAGAVMAKQEIQKKIGEMQELMSKDVEELAAKEGGVERQTIKVRGRSMVIPDSGPRRATAVIFMCLYALENQEIDRIFRELDLKGYFSKDDGSVELAPLISGGQDHGAPPSTLKGRNILLESIQPDSAPIDIVGVRGIYKKIERLGIIVGPMGKHGVPIRFADGSVDEIPEDRFTKLDTAESILAASVEIASPM